MSLEVCIRSILLVMGSLDGESEVCFDRYMRISKIQVLNPFLPLLIFFSYCLEFFFFLSVCFHFYTNFTLVYIFSSNLQKLL